MGLREHFLGDSKKAATVRVNFQSEKQIEGTISDYEKQMIVSDEHTNQCLICWNYRYAKITCLLKNNFTYIPLVDLQSCLFRPILSGETDRWILC